MNTEHTFRVTVNRHAHDPIDAGTVTYHGRDYETFTEVEALPLVVSEIDFTHAEHGFLMFRGKMLPTADFAELSVTLITKQQTPAAE